MDEALEAHMRYTLRKELRQKHTRAISIGRLVDFKGFVNFRLDTVFPFRGFACWITWRCATSVSSTNWGGGYSRCRSSRKAGVYGAGQVYSNNLRN